ncbi:c-type cytochrome [Elioraea thermophila]|uniref:c-type cytochrome n=1 Tax=Elioraea thermophila TaxID=2185104 RepID=UPI000DF4C708|nr:cytochrome c [Elioraea thermophila]
MMVLMVLRATALAAVLVLPPTLAFAQAGVIAERQAGFRMLRDRMEAIQTIVQMRDPNSEAVPHARAIAEHAPKIKTLFPPGSDGQGSRALPAIWTDRAGFERVADAFVQRAEALLAAAQGNDQRALAQAFEATGQACGACHRPYRQPQR